LKHFVIIMLILMSILILSTAICFAAAGATEETGSQSALAESVRYIAAALSVGMCAIATGIAQSRIGAAGMGSIVEKPETTGTVIICIAIPETMVILGFVVAAIIIIL
jgi:V/A-type H+/Na+-transporting ATPase subunit K